jgi:hypothetical protein
LQIILEHVFPSTHDEHAGCLALFTSTKFVWKKYLFFPFLKGYKSVAKVPKNALIASENIYFLFPQINVPLHISICSTQELIIFCILIFINMISIKFYLTILIGISMISVMENIFINSYLIFNQHKLIQRDLENLLLYFVYTFYFSFL